MTTLRSLASILALVLAGCAAAVPPEPKVPATETPYDARLLDLNRRLCLEARGVWLETPEGWECRNAEKRPGPPVPRPGR